MDYIKYMGCLLLIFYLFGCSFLQEAQRKESQKEDNKQQELFLYTQNQWRKPLVQKVRIPAHIAGGVFYPEHDEMVIIRPGEWQMSESVSMKQEDIQQTQACYLDQGGVDITALPIRKHYFKGDDE